jgi:hypothetical protein
MLHTHVNPTNLEPGYVARVKADHDYIHQRGMLTGTYVLLQNPPGLNASTEIIDPDDGTAEGIACFATTFHRQLWTRAILSFFLTPFSFADMDNP